MKKARKWILYTLYVVAAASFFLYYLFPSEKVKDYITHRFEESNPGYSLTMENVKPSFPPGLAFTSVSLYHLDKGVIDFEKLTISPVLLSMIKPEKSFDFKGKTCQGAVEGVAKIDFKKSGKPPVSVEADFNGIQIDKIKAVELLSDVKLSGVLDGKMIMKRELADQTGDTTFSISQCNVALTSTMLKSLGALTFKSVDGEILLKNREIDIKKFTVKGEQINGHVLGLVTMRDDFKKSGLNLTGKIKPHPSFLADNRIAAMVLRTKKGSGDISFLLKGTIGKPMFNRR